MINEGTPFLEDSRYRDYISSKRCRLVGLIIAQIIYNSITITVAILNTFTTIKSYRTEYYGNPTYNLKNLNICVIVASGLIAIINVQELLINLYCLISGNIRCAGGICSMSCYPEFNTELDNDCSLCSLIFILGCLFSISTGIALFVYNLNYWNGYSKISGILSLIMACITLIYFFLDPSLIHLIKKTRDDLTHIYYRNHLPYNMYQSIKDRDIIGAKCGLCHGTGKRGRNCGLSISPLNNTIKTKCTDCEVEVISEEIYCRLCKGNGYLTSYNTFGDSTSSCPKTETVYKGRVKECGNCYSNSEYIPEKDYYDLPSEARAVAARKIGFKWKSNPRKCSDECNIETCWKCRGTGSVLPS